MKHVKPSQYMVGAWVTFVAFLTPCVIERPELFQTNRGISDYGINRLTIIPFSIGTLSSIILVVLAARSLPSDSSSRRTARNWLSVVAALQLGLLLIPDLRNTMARQVHIGFGISLFVVEFALSVWFALLPIRKRAAYSLLFVLALSGIFSFLSLIHSTGILAQSEVTFQLSFMAMCVLALRRIE